jgi:hypothetical protein
MSVVDDIVAFLAAQSTAFTILSGTAGNLAKQIMFDHDHWPDTVTSVYETAGSANEYTFSTSTGRANVEFERPSFQILSRSTSYATARTRAQTAYTLLDGLADRSLPTATGTRYLEITAVQAPFVSGRDENDRYIVSTNYDTWKTV